MSKSNVSLAGKSTKGKSKNQISPLVDAANMIRQIAAELPSVQAAEQREIRKTVALETIARHLGAIENYLDRIIDGNSGSLKIKGLLTTINPKDLEQK